MWSTFGAGRLERCVEICDAGSELAVRIGTLPVQYPTIKGMALMDLGRFDQAWQAFEDEIADEAHRFGRAVQSLGRFQYELNVGAYDDAIARAPLVTDESKALSRVWMLDWIAYASALTMLGPAGKTHKPQLLQIIDATEQTLSGVGKAALLLAQGSFEEGVDVLQAVLQKGSQYLSVRQRLTTFHLLAVAHAERSEWRPALDFSQQAISQADELCMSPLLWRLYLLRAQSQSGLGQAAEAETSSHLAESIWQEVADSIPDTAHRRHYTLLAERAGL